MGNHSGCSREGRQLSGSSETHKIMCVDAEPERHETECDRGRADRSVAFGFRARHIRALLTLFAFRVRPHPMCRYACSTAKRKDN
jgi:hypothetical protein